MGAEVFDVHDMDPREFEARVHSFEFWFESVRGYLEGQTYGHRPDTPEAALTPAERPQLSSP